jgi:hypothetical protein
LHDTKTTTNVAWPAAVPPAGNVLSRTGASPKRMRLFGVGCQVPREQTDRDGSPGLNSASRVTLNGAMTNPKRPRGRPPSPQGAKPRAQSSAPAGSGGKPPARCSASSILGRPRRRPRSRNRGRDWGNALRNLELRERDGQRLEARNAYLEGELRRARSAPHERAERQHRAQEAICGTAQAARAPG